MENFTVTLSAEAWNAVLSLMARGPYVDVKPLIDTMVAQLVEQEKKRNQPVEA